MNLKELSLFITEPLVVDSEELSQRLLANRLVKRHADSPGLDENKLEEPQEEYPEEDSELVFEGEFQKGILVIYQGTGLSEETTGFLLKILQAVGCSLKDIALLSDQGLMGKSLDTIEIMAPNKVLVFGRVNHPIMNLKKSNYEIHAEGAEYFFADELGELEKNIPLKKKLWASLQVLFNIK
ncbi:hypothetical protein [Pleomorphovibrio marinus]|uniref:hypothetical protein n=1 Tax=Pleomorphovibrio marinus TaxID=2164132 RepID=UPI000E0C531A|nr:hypothetical protein [Pleomorphovibrio marinus]